ncbi:UDP-N-acetylglucosamine 1-carboxyvinyltransferase [Coriobacteriia bacterium Es71-Z0120]|uniref:UDP-N-acetylglucosamine 1-carboxyvinyltransferase n=1 Tax=Parvivirga hydrogeniphila TaxID=2939460 RepID=UPI002261037C|nr:UDP-N-acetylglucosamine 1-carboxyvinyltransferase [Parvivirga hydrogeniphila]MCL4078780.1 UDP-N-acetylglucosamine 1-carboxyvinyltransferase [Parvivirga hydrogeniphila]
MSRAIHIAGGRALRGTVTVSGAKNAVLKHMAAAILAEGVSTFHRVPRIADVEVMSEVLRRLGADVRFEGDTAFIDTTSMDSFEAPYDLVATMRASILVLGPLVARFGTARVAMPGGCNIGSRKIDLHLKGLQQLGASISSEHGYIEASAPTGLSGAHIFLDFPSVGATENLLMAAVKARGTTTIENAAREPEIQDLIALLGAMGARIEGAGTSTLVVEGVPELRPAEHTVIGDRIEAGTMLVAGALAAESLTVEGADPAHLELVLSKLADAGVPVSVDGARMTVAGPGRFAPVDVATLPYPGFPTDMQPQFMTLLSLADGDSVITENVFESRFMFADELRRMGADITIDGHRAIVRGVKRLSGAPVKAPDLRGGAALVLAGLVAEGETLVGDTYHIERGYEDLVGKLAAVGAAIEWVEAEGGDVGAHA